MLAARELDDQRDDALVREVRTLERFVDFDQHHIRAEIGGRAGADEPVRSRPRSARTKIHSENEGLNPKQSPALRAKPVSGV
jgi:hypothetical protein